MLYTAFRTAAIPTLKPNDFFYSGIFPLLLLVINSLFFCLFVFQQDLDYGSHAFQTNRISLLNGNRYDAGQHRRCGIVFMVQDTFWRHYEKLNLLSQQLASGLKQCEREIGNHNFDLLLQIFSELRRLISNGILETRRLMNLLVRASASHSWFRLENRLFRSLNEDLGPGSCSQDMVAFETESMIDDLHDDVLPKLATILMGVQVCEELLFEDLARMEKEIAKLNSMATSLEQELTQFYFKNHLDRVKVVGLEQAVREFTDDLKGCCNFAFYINVFGNEDDVSKKTKIHLLSIIREALMNLSKHAKPERADVELHFKSDRVLASITDDGKGFVLESGIAKSNSLGRRGLTSMKDSAQSLGGTLIIETSPGQGTRVVVSVPLRQLNTKQKEVT